MIEGVRNELPEVFAPRDVIAKVKARYPQDLDATIRAFVIGFASNHPSSKYYPQRHKIFYYLGNGRFRNLDESKAEAMPIESEIVEEIDAWSVFC